MTSRRLVTRDVDKATQSKVTTEAFTFLLLLVTIVNAVAKAGGTSQ